VALTFAMVVVGGITRLTGSGLSIVRWEPLIGVLPPLSHGDWERVFALYRESPQFRLVNHAMDLEAFKGIFWLEWVHRLLGRVIGAVVIIPGVWFAVRRRIRWPQMKRLAAIVLLGALQGGVGWYMVQSGLVDDPRVSHLRLTLHLGLGVLIFAALLCEALDIAKVADAPPTLWIKARALALVSFVTVLSGGLMAGLRAGALYPTFPLMHGKLLPEGIGSFEPVWRNLWDNAITVHAQHRWLGFLVLVGTLVVFPSAYRFRPTRAAALCLAVTTLAQVALGALTVLAHVPILLASLHQANALLLVASAMTLVLQVPRKSRS